jgi:hypothetical protein
MNYRCKKKKSSIFNYGHLIHNFTPFPSIAKKKKKKKPPLSFHMCEKEGEVKMTLKHNKYNPIKISLYLIHGSKFNLGCEFDV